MATAKPPATVTVGPYRISVVCTQAAIDRASMECSSELAGHFDSSAQQIRLAPDLAPDIMAESLLHEVLHAVAEAAGKPLGRSSDEEERMISALAPGLLDTLRRNPDVVNYLLAS